MKKTLFTSESVTEGHPDKVCDQISDAILDSILRKAPDAHVACEVSATTGLVVLMGEISSNALHDIDVEQIVRDTIRDIGYTGNDFGFNADGIAVVSALHSQSPDIAQGVNNALETRSSSTTDMGAGDQGMVFGYATDETAAYLPMPIHLAHQITRKLAEVRKSGLLPYLGPDGKAQVSVEYEGDRPVRIDTVVLSTQHLPDITHDIIERDMIQQVIKPIIPPELLDEHTHYLINPTGRFVIGGPQGDAGLTGRKIIVDTYGGFARHGGGAFSGKDPTKVDRSAAYAARYVAKNLVAAGIARKCEIQIAYAIGVARPVSILIDTFGTGIISDTQILALVENHFDLRPSAMIENLDLRRPIYKDTAAYGHFGREDLHLPWERTDKAEDLRQELKKNS